MLIPSRDRKFILGGGYIYGNWKLLTHGVATTKQTTIDQIERKYGSVSRQYEPVIVQGDIAVHFFFIRDLLVP